MPVPQNKAGLLHDMHETYHRLRVDLQSIPPGKTRARELEGHAKGTQMSVCDVLAYLTGWGNLVLKWHGRKQDGLPVDFPETGYAWNELGALAQKFYADYAADDFDTLLQKFDATVRALLLLVESLSEDELYGGPWYGKYTLGRMIQLNSSSPYKNARIRIRRWKKTA